MRKQGVGSGDHGGAEEGAGYEEDDVNKINSLLNEIVASEFVIFLGKRGSSPDHGTSSYSINQYKTS